MIDKVIDNILTGIEDKEKKKTTPVDRIGTVRRIDGNIAWVHINNGVDVTPVIISGANCSVGDEVLIKLAGGSAYIIGNNTSPPTDDAEALLAKMQAAAADKHAAKAYEEAREAKKSVSENAEYFANVVMAINSDIENIQEQIDGNITSWFYEVDPAMNLPPVALDPSDPDNTGWDTDEKKNNHLGDLYYNVNNGKVWRFVFANGAFSWSPVEDSDVTRALEIATRAQDTADSKRRVFVTTPVPPYDVGDLWAQGDQGDLYRCAQAKTSSGTYSANDWVKATKYTDDTALTTWINGAFAQEVASLEAGIVDAKVETYYTGTDPSTNWTAAQKTQHTGDLWYNSTSNKYYRWSGTAWQEVKATPPQAVFDSIDGKATIYVGSTTPTSPHAKDLWFKSANDDILTYVGNSWVKYNKYTDDTRANQAYSRADAAMTSANGKNKVYHQSSQPTGGTYISGDTWFNTDDGYKMYVYNGTSWVAEQFGGAAIADASITNAKIANATIQSAKISGLDVGKLTGGYIDASHINAGELSIGQSQVTGLVSDLASKADNSDIPTALSDLTNDEGFITSSSVPTKVSQLTNDSGFQNATQVESTVTGKGYQTASQVESAITSKGYQTASDVSSAVSSGVAGKADKTAVIKAVVSVYYRSTTNSTPSITTSTSIGTSATTDNAWEYVMPQPKRDRYFYTCERYTYADNSVSFSTVRALASETYASKWVSSSDNTYIDGGKIYANSVTASQIDATNLHVNSANIDGDLSIGKITNLQSTLNGKADTGDIPTAVSDLTNDTGFITSSSVPTKVSQLTNDSGFQNASQVDTAITDKGYQTASQVDTAITGKGYQTASQVDTAITGKGYQTASQVESAITGKEYQTASQVESAITGKGYQTASQVSTAVSNGVAGKADKTVAVKSTVSVYYRSTTSNTPSIGSSTSIGTSATTDNAWEYVMPQPKRDRYFYTCEKYTFADNSVSFSTVRELTSQTYASKYVSSNDNTYIDGGRIYASSITSAKIAAGAITAEKIATGAIMISSVTNLQTTLNGKADNSDIPTAVSDLTNDTGFITSASVPTKVSQLTNDSSFATTTQVGTAKSEAISTAASDATSKANAAQSAAETTAASDATSKANAAQAAAISAAASDATTKANAAAQTATNFIQADANGIKIAKTVGSATSYSYINADGMKVYKGGELKATFGDSAVFQKVYNGTTYTLTLTEGYVQIGSSTYTTGALIKSSDGLYINSDNRIIMRSPNYGLMPPILGSTEITLGGDTEVRGNLDVSGDFTANNVQAGASSFSSTASGSKGSKSINFPYSFSKVPKVMATFTEDSIANFGGCTIAVTSVSKTGATFKLFNNSGSSKSPAFSWLAISI